ncbi:hypothetical protein PSCICO_44140 [Pseudomonas cichorii]|uniref:Mor transcription activator domain-containing protein n=2 Tax=Pseudomonas syringae group TaxID=136849 RepID=A0A3M4W7R8_PSECI|nr:MULTISPECIES: hypothetical protein [Pseudomonas]MDO7930056.1 hypothetical protein [Pseudomonas sp. KFB-138]QVE18671.1 hypothetical protein KGD89_08090 [Pseudomonas cichorii]RMR60056.1 hypothetical protein ALP84_01369 [Pseudomonas cichorii]SDO04205.1 hypothetical protein SAMN05216599_105112 [Pseudomonas cichorii]GFM74375.1 hypothetical protein PSCICM_01940 [Pseudomonas cichorii]
MADIDFYTLFSGLPDRDDDRFSQIERFYLVHRHALLCTLPWLAAELAENDGILTMSCFIRRYGGSRLYINKSHQDFLKKIEIIISEKTHKQFITHVGASGSLDIPSAWGIFNAFRKVAIQQAITEDMPAQKIANCFGVTERHLRNLAHRELLKHTVS